MLFVPILACLLTIPFAFRVTERLSTSGWLPATAESVQVADILKNEFGRNTTSHFLLFEDPTGELKATDDEFRREVAKVVAPLHSDPHVSAVYTWGSTGNETLNRTLISGDGSKSLAIVVMVDQEADRNPGVNRFQAQIHSDRLQVEVGGWAATAASFTALTRSDLVRSEQLALPITLLLLFLVFGGVLAAGLPIALSLLALAPTLAGIYLLSLITETSLFAVNTVSMLGLAIGVDYALVMVSRFREELRENDTETAVANAMATAGETIIVAGAAVMVGMLGMLTFPVSAAISTGLAASLMVLLSVILATTALPAALSLFAHRLSHRPKWRLPGIRLPQISDPVRRHPVVAIILSVASIAILTLPTLEMRGAASSMTVLPKSQEARNVYDTVASEFPHTTLTPIVIVVTPTSGRMTSTANLNDLLEFQTELSRLENVRSVQSVWSFLPFGVTSSIVSTTLLLNEDIKEISRPYLTDNVAVIEVAPLGGPSDESTMALVREIRENGYALSQGAFRIQIGAEIGTNVDLVDYVKDRAPFTVAIVIGLMWIALFVRFRSLVLPTKAVLLNLLSIGASFGMLVWIFQEGHLHEWLGFEPLGYTILLVPIIMFSFLFGMSMDYEVVMLSRIKEAWDQTGNNDLAIEHGLAATARLVTSAALIMLTIFIAFGTSELQFIKQIGVGLGIAVLIDTTLIRLVLLPSTMRLFGRWNWWSPWSNP
jgi:RND superfamily putative drug exporter